MICSDYGSLPVWHQAIIRSNDGLYPIRPLTHWGRVTHICVKMSFKIPSAQFQLFYPERKVLTHWGQVTHICVGKITIIGSDNGLSPGRRQAIIQTNDGILLIEPLGTNFSEIWSEIHTFSFKKMHLKLSSAKWRPFCLGLNVLKTTSSEICINI